MQERIAVVFYFDDTLEPDSTTGFLKHAGLKDIDSFWQEVGTLMADDWDPVPAYLNHMVTVSQYGRIKPITQLGYWGESLPFFDGVSDVFAYLRDVVKNTKPDLVNFLTMAVRSLAERIAVAASSYQG